MRYAYSLALILRAGLLLLVLTGEAYALLSHQPVYWVPGLLLVAALVAEQVRYLNRSNQDLADFLAALRYEDYALAFNSQAVPASAGQLRQAFNQLSASFQQLSRQKEAQHLYLQQVLGLINTGILSFLDLQTAPVDGLLSGLPPAAPLAPGQVRWLNESLKQLLGVPYLKNIEALRQREPALYDIIRALKPGDSRLIRLRQQPVLLSATAFTDEQGRTVLLAFQPVREALEENEVQAYQKLLRVLTHEIMNSVAPIVSLADSLQQQLATLAPAQVPAELRNGLAVINKRSEGLLHFTQVYRQLSKLSATAQRPVFVWALFEHVVTLLEPTFAQRGIEPEIVLADTELCIVADPALIEQVLINLLTNALDALQGQPTPQLRLLAYCQSTYRVVLEVADNGAGIPVALLEEIFVPFVTTKKHGSGIGLSLSRQIMQLHQGSIQVQSEEGVGSQFLLIFPKQ